MCNKDIRNEPSARNIWESKYLGEKKRQMHVQKKYDQPALIGVSLCVRQERGCVTSELGHKVIWLLTDFLLGSGHPGSIATMWKPRPPGETTHRCCG